ncbi:MAG: archaemetzincin family Zn-dependent metalloprotease [Proteobacteria bacterium]|nr:archaemetzincin family Zn-dependent metalloprotease [Pseudomonadota bacterium]
MQNLVLIPIGTMTQNVADFLSLSLPEILNAPCRIMEGEVALEPFYSSDRKQYHSTEILRQLLPFAKGNEHHIIGIMDEDLYIPILTFVFGEAQLGGRCALMSGHRLHQEFYGLPQDESLYLHRCEKEAVHELGHTLGLKHCSNFECVMRYSNSVADIDIKRNVFCPSCSDVLGIPSLW